MTQTTLPPPTTMSNVTAHLIADHDWAPNTPINGEHARAHDYLHGVGRPDLADRTLNHAHRITMSTSWPGPASPPADWQPTAKRRPLTYVILGWNVLMAAWLVYALFSTGALMGRDCVTDACRTGVSVGATVAVIGILFLTAMVDVILAVIWLVTKKD